jgi:hypothetical protein
MQYLRCTCFSKTFLKGDFMITRNIGMLLLAIYLILVGVSLVAAIAIPSIVLGLLALIAGIFILIGR